MTQWTTAYMPDLTGRVALITGANSGLGLETARALAAHGAHVILTSRSVDKGQRAMQRLQAQFPLAKLEYRQLDLASQRGIREFAREFQQEHSRLDLLFNNAGVMAIPRSETVDGFETQFGTNHLGHFALTGLLLPTLLETPNSRIITTSSMARRFGELNFDDLQRKHAYSRWEAYGQSKKANLLFAFELQRRLKSIGSSTLSVAAHPGFANTNLQSVSATTSNSRFEVLMYKYLNPSVAQSAAMGALPQLFAATSSMIFGGELVGPGGFLGMRGYPKVEARSQREYNASVARRLWDISTELTGVDVAALAPAVSVN
ncbi:oxidoreductase [Tengunoibacter tsumagoiensis]|uniref:Short-chain dehydrogenase n=1 Tax=Tengunoibacter tsumagoiensis TaxID=2014871 RepID=A0A401ZVQ2_9CHLR|nr:oxidoreductase [Tengunoibacter tsumagoiensis]GCE10830.1 short-chain dehydrogenase [Tengunoibacter tsumagoiensis]